MQTKTFLFGPINPQIANKKKFHNLFISNKLARRKSFKLSIWGLMGPNKNEILLKHCMQHNLKSVQKTILVIGYPTLNTFTTCCSKGSLSSQNWMIFWREKTCSFYNLHEPSCNVREPSYRLPEPSYNLPEPCLFWEKKALVRNLKAPIWLQVGTWRSF